MAGEEDSDTAAAVTAAMAAAGKLYAARYVAVRAERWREERETEIGRAHV